MKIMTILGTRPEIIRLSRIIPTLDKRCSHTLVHTGQNFDKNLSDIFFEDLRLRAPDIHFVSKAETPMSQIAKILMESEKIFSKVKPDRLLLLGDTNSSLSAIVAKRMGIQVFHMEAGNRCYDDRVPEEINRRIIDHSSDVLLPYTEISKSHLIKEGIAESKIFVTGNPIKEVIDFYSKESDASSILSKLKLQKDSYFLVTLHRAENVDIESRLQQFLLAFKLLYKKYKIPIICSLHPRTKNQLELSRLELSEGVISIDPPGFFDFIHLEQNARCVLSDSGTVQEECCIFKVPNVTLRDVTERPETIEVGSNYLTGADAENILKHVEKVLSTSTNWTPPREYLVPNVSEIVASIILK